MAAKERTQDEKNLKILRELAALSANKYCFDCRQRGPTYVNVTIGSFVCTSCSGILRGLNPPHRVKSITMTIFTPEEIEFMKSRGNEYCRCVWLGKFDSRSSIEPEMQSTHRVREYMIQKYEEKKWYVEPDVAIKQLQLHQQQTVSAPNLVQETKTQSVKQPVQSNQSSRSASWSSVSRFSAVQPQGKPQTEVFNQFGADPFVGSTKSSGIVAPSDSFADFSSVFDNAAPNTQMSLAVMPSSTKSVQLAAYTSTPSFSATLPPQELPSPSMSQGQLTSCPPAADKYAALADLDIQLHLQSTQHQPSLSSSTTPSLWSGSSTTLYGGPTVLGSNSVYGGTDKSNPFRDTTPTWSQTSLISSANPFHNVSQPTSGVSCYSSYIKPPIGTSQFSVTPTGSLPNGDSNQLGLQKSVLGTSPWAAAPGTVTGWGSGLQNGQMDIFQNNKGNHVVENLNPWPQQPGNAVGVNPFVNGSGTSGLPTSGLQTNSTNNPFL